MKKIRTNKKGFTLVEIIIVVAIIIIISAASFVGIAVILNNAKANADKVNQQHGVDENGKALFEADAWEKVDGLTKDAAKFFDASKYKPANPTNTPTPTPTPADNGTGTVATPTPTVAPTAAPTVEPTATPEPTQAAASGGIGTNAPGSSITTSDDWWNGKLQFDKGVQKITVVCPNGGQLEMNQWQYSMKNLGNNKYEITYQGDGNGRTPQTSITVRIPSDAYIESYS